MKVGNIYIGGTGKTPHTEYLLYLLCDKKTAVLSRGYNRKTNKNNTKTKTNRSYNNSNKSNTKTKTNT